jgi:hypothetical protein
VTRYPVGPEGQDDEELLSWLPRLESRLDDATSDEDRLDVLGDYFGPDHAESMMANLAPVAGSKSPGSRTPGKAPGGSPAKSKGADRKGSASRR